MYNKIINYVEETLVDYGFGKIEVIEDDVLAYNCMTNTLHICYKKEDDEFEEFMVEYLKEEFDLEISKDKLYTFYILHELGHKETIDKVDVDRYYDEVERIDKHDYLSYRKIFAEYLADNWAVQFIKTFEGILNL